MTPRIFVSAGEPSGDMHAARVVRALWRRFPEARIDAFGGPELEAAGATIAFPMEPYTVMGFAEILHKIPAHLRLLQQLGRRFRAGAYDLLLCVDYPGFHLRLAQAARHAGARVLYYIAPQLWAWRPERAQRLRAGVDRLAVIFPFEEPFFQGLDIPATYVGHPLLDQVPWPSRAEARVRLGIGAAERVIAVFPGSRRQEVRRLWPAFRDAISTVLEQGVADRALAAARPGLAYPNPGRLELSRGDSRDILAAADAALVKSGTTALEAALCDVPMVVAYRVHRLTELLARRLIRVPWVSPVNLVAQAPVVEELLQRDVTVDRLTAALRRLLEPGHPATILQREGLARVRERLGSAGAGERVAALAAELLA